MKFEETLVKLDKFLEMNVNKASINVAKGDIFAKFVTQFLMKDKHYANQFVEVITYQEYAARSMKNSANSENAGGGSDFLIV